MTFICLMKKYNIMIYNFKKFNERLRISDLDENTASQIKNNLLFRLKELRTSILLNMDIKIDSRTILRQFTKEFTKEIIDELNIEEFINDINDILDSESVTKRKVRDHFQKLYDKIKK
jgi:predicted hydrocarbon binding protein